jgi:hypothetical protein
VREKFKVTPTQMTDYLCLVGDASDNIKGASGIGGVRAAALLGTYGSLDGLYAAIDAGATPDITPTQRTSLQEFRARWPIVRQLVALKDDVEIPFEEVAAERVPKDVEPQTETMPNGTTTAVDEVFHPTSPSVPSSVTTLVPLSSSIDYDRQLEPRSLEEAFKLARHIFAARLNFGSYGAAEAVFSTILAGRELGMSAMASLRGFHIIQGRPTLSAATIQALILRSGKAKFFRCIERTNERATFETQRGDDPIVTLTYTIEDGQRAWDKDEKAWKASGWQKNPADMCVARAGSKLARLVYPDILSGFYASEEMD